MTKTLRNPAIYILFLAPTIALLGIFFFYPLVNAFYYGFTKWNGVGQPKFIGLDNLKAAIDDPDLLRSIINNAYVFLFSCIIALPGYFVLAMLISKVQRFASVYKIVYFVPVILSTAIIGIMWGVVLDPDIGIVNGFLRFIGLDQFAMYWLADPKTAMISVLIVNAWQWAGFNIILFLTGIYGIPKEINESSQLDGANSFQNTLHIVIPMIRPVIAVVFLLTVIGAMKTLDIVYVMTKGGPVGTTDVMATHMIEQAYSRQKYGYANMIAILIFLITLVFSLLANYMTRKWEES